MKVGISGGGNEIWNDGGKEREESSRKEGERQGLATQNGRLINIGKLESDFFFCLRLSQ